MAPAFCDQTGRLLACPQKPVKRVARVAFVDPTEEHIFIWPDEDDYPDGTMLGAWVVANRGPIAGFMVVETTNSVYVGKPTTAC